MDDLRKRFGRLVAAHRRRQGMTQEDLAQRAGVSTDMIGRIETGGTGARFPTIQKLAEALKVDPAELFSSEVPRGALDRKSLVDITARLAGLSERELSWVGGLLDAALKPRS
jgi:transcriptional regulator with XRE-family HTH domain